MHLLGLGHNRIVTIAPCVPTRPQRQNSHTSNFVDRFRLSRPIMSYKNILQNVIHFFIVFVHLLGLEPRMTVPKTGVISVSLQVQLYYSTTDCIKIKVVYNLTYKTCGHGLVVGRLLAKEGAGVRFSLTAQSICFT